MAPVNRLTATAPIASSTTAANDHASQRRRGRSAPPAGRSIFSFERSFRSMRHSTGQGVRFPQLLREEASMIARSAVVLLLLSALAGGARAEDAQGRTLEELKAETIARGDRNAYPLIGIKAADVREAMGRLKTLDRDEWAASWSAVRDRSMKEKDFHQAWLVYSF